MVERIVDLVAWFEANKSRFDQLPQLGPQGCYLRELFRRAAEINRTQDDPWICRTLLERAERRVISDHEMISGMAAGMNGSIDPDRSLLMIYNTTLDRLGTSLFGLLAKHKEGLPIYRMVDGQVVRLEATDDIGVNLTLGDLMEQVPFGAEAHQGLFPHPWASLLYHRHVDVHWHSLMFGEHLLPIGAVVASPGQPPDQTTTTAAILRRNRMMRDQFDLRRAALKAVLSGGISVAASALTDRDVSLDVLRGPSEEVCEHTRKILTFVDMLDAKDADGDWAESRAKAQELIGFLLEAVVGWRKGQSDATNPFIALLRQETIRYPLRGLIAGYEDLARILYAGWLGTKQKADDFISIRDYIANETCRRLRVLILRDLQILRDGLVLAAKEGCLTLLYQDFIRDQQRRFDLALGRCYMLVWQGVPLYDSSQAILPAHHPDAVYMRMKAERRDTSNAGSQSPGVFPPWIGDYYFRASHLEAHRRRFGRMARTTINYLPVFDNEQVRPLRAALLNDIGLSDRDGTLAPADLGTNDRTVTQSNVSKNATADERIAHAYEQIKTLSGFELVKLLCEATVFSDWMPLHTPEATRTEQFKTLTNPFLIVLAGTMHYWPRVHMSHFDLALIWLNKIADIEKAWAREDREKPPAESPPFVSLLDYIASNTELPDMDNSFGNLLGGRADIGIDVEYCMYLYFHQHESSFDKALDSVCKLVYHGVRLYTNDSDEPLPSSHPDAVYLAKKAEYCEAHAGASSQPGRFPRWAPLYRVSDEDLRLHDEHFGRKQYLTATQVRALRAAMLSEMGIAIQSVETGGKDESNMRSALVDLEEENLRLQKENAELRATRDVDTNDKLYPPKLDLANRAFTAAYVEKQKDPDPNPNTILGKGIGEFLAEFLVEANKRLKEPLDPTPLKRIAEIVKFPGVQGRPPENGK